ncbi:MAG: hypothetical protein KBD01_16395 [Acidobacteria bacterium]|nr:hypothetical protein [Acidobacteriota bacterium]
MPKIFINDPGGFLDQLERDTGEKIPRPTDLKEDDCPICRALGIDPTKSSVTRVHGGAVFTIPLPFGIRLPSRRRRRRP